MVEKALEEQVINKEPKTIDPRFILVIPRNRDGSPPNVPYLHYTLIKNILIKGFDRTRPQVGICIEFRSESGKKALIEHNRRFSKGNSLLPPIYEDEVLYGSLAFSHGNLALRIFQAGLKSPAGDLGKALEDQPSLKEVVHEGHRWWVLPESLAKECQVDISVWRNQDQNDNHGTHEVEILQTIVATAENLSETSKKVILGDIVAKALKRNPAKISPKVINCLAKFWMQYLESGDQHLVHEFIEWHASEVNPKELVLSNSFFEILVGEAELTKHSLCRMYLVYLQYTMDKVVAQAGGPSKGAFLEPAVIVNLAKKKDILETLEKDLEKLRQELLPKLEEFVSPSIARTYLALYIILILRSILGKPWPLDCPFKVSVPAGRHSEERVRALGKCWASWIDSLHKESNFGTSSGLALVETSEELQESVDLSDLRALKRIRSEPDAPPFERGDEVTVVRRMSWPIPLPSKPDFRKDIVEGTSGTIEGFVDTNKNQVLLKVKIKLPNGTSKEVIQAAYPRNLQKTSEWTLSQAALASEKTSTKSGSGSGSSASSVPEWLLGSSDPDKVKEVKDWKNLLAESDTLIKVFGLKGRIGVALEALQEQVPTYTSKDFVVINRQNSFGIWQSEVWTKRAFKEKEILFAPLSSQLKDTHLMASANAVVGLPKHGRGAHPEQQTLALDGRSRSRLAHKDTVDSQEHKGNLFWIVGRTPSPSEANMTLENTSFEQKVTLVLPDNKKRKLTSEWGSSELPQIPVLINQKAIEAHKRLMVLVADKNIQKAASKVNARGKTK